MDFEHSENVQIIQGVLRQFMARRVLPMNIEWHRQAESGIYPLGIIEPLKKIAKEEGLWNLFLPTLRESEPGTRLSNLEYAPLAEIMGRIPWASEVFNCSAPDSGNIELLHMVATDKQYKKWLKPLMDGDIRSCFAMSEPDVASSDATNIQTTIRRDGNEYVVNGRKWFITGASHPNCSFTIVFGVSDDPNRDAHKRHSMIIVPMDTNGVNVLRNIPIMHHSSPEGHCEIRFTEVRVPIENLLGEEGNGFVLAQARLGPGRIHHCMRTIGQCELALEMMCERALERRTFGKYLGDYSNIQDWIALSRVEIDQARLLVLRAAWLIDMQGNRAARVDVSAIKLVAAQLQTRVLDRAMQIFGAMGLTPYTPLSYLWTWGRAMRFFDGPDETHLRVVARNELARAKVSLGASAAYYLVD